MNPAVIIAAANLVNLASQIVTQVQAGDMTEEDALVALDQAHKNVKAAFKNFAESGDGQG